jgi:MoaA/NifB/PqqE/SkfB family radical SAM enzyme
MSYRDLYTRIKNIVNKLIPMDSLLYHQLKLFQLRITSEQRLRRKPLLQFGVHFADHCNLNCKGCDNFSPIADEKYLDIETFDRDCARIAELTGGQISGMAILGGEPLLHPQFTELIDVIRKYFTSGEIKIITNGLLLLKEPEEFWHNCRKNKTRITITKYPVKLDDAAIGQAAEKYGVNVEWYGDTGIRKKTMWCIPFDLDGVQKIRNNFKLCYKPNTCTMLEDGKIYICPTVAYINYFNRHFNQNLQVSNGDYIDIYQIKSVNEIFDFLSKPIPFCRYCNIKKTMYGLSWDVSKKEISEWT